MVYSEPSQTSKVELFAQILKVEKLLTILVERFASDAWHGSEYVCPPELLDGFDFFTGTKTKEGTENWHRPGIYMLGVAMLKIALNKIFLFFKLMKRIFSALGANPKKWSNTLKQFIGYFVGLALKVLMVLFFIALLVLVNQISRFIYQQYPELVGDYSGVFRTLSNICGRAFLWKLLTAKS